MKPASENKIQAGLRTGILKLALKKPAAKKDRRNATDNV